MFNLNKNNLAVDISKKTANESLKINSITDLFWQQAYTHPDNIGVADEHHKMTYKELMNHSSDLATYLQYLGVKLDNPVRIFVEPSIDLMIMIWGILIAGGTYLPLSPEYPENRLNYRYHRMKMHYCKRCAKSAKGNRI